MQTLLEDHLKDIENVLLAQSRIPANSGHSLHKGTPRENFLKTFLIDHLSERVAIGQGEIFDASSQANQARHQNDIVIYRRNFPRIAFDKTISGYLAESVVATIEVKSTLSKEDLTNAIRASHDIKQLKRNDYKLMYSGYQPPSILSYVVAYSGPASMTTVADWLNPIHQELSIPYPVIPSENPWTTPSPSLDGIFVLGKGYATFANSPITLSAMEQIKKQSANIKWYFSDTESGSLTFLFLLLTNAINSMAETYLDATKYITQVHRINFGGIIG